MVDSVIEHISYETMSLRYRCLLFRTGDTSAFRRALQAAVESAGGTVEWGESGGAGELIELGATQTVQSLYLPSGSDLWAIPEAIASALKVPWLDLSINEEAMWSYVLVVDGQTVDDFSTLPQYWDMAEDADADPLAGKFSDPRVLAETWQVPVERVERYLVNWGMQNDPDDSGVYHTILQDKAYPTDEHPYGECRQMFDFMKALGGKMPDEAHRVMMRRPDADSFL